METSEFLLQPPPRPCSVCPSPQLYCRVTWSLATIHPMAGSMQECLGSALWACSLPVRASVLSSAGAAIQSHTAESASGGAKALLPATRPSHTISPRGLQPSDQRVPRHNPLSQKTTFRLPLPLSSLSSSSLVTYSQGLFKNYGNTCTFVKNPTSWIAEKDVLLAYCKYWHLTAVHPKRISTA